MADRTKTEPGLEREHIEGAPAPPDRRGHTRVGAPTDSQGLSAPVNAVTKDLTAEERALLGDLFAVIGEHSAREDNDIDRKQVPEQSSLLGGEILSHRVDGRGEPLRIRGGSDSRMAAPVGRRRSTLDVLSL